MAWSASRFLGVTPKYDHRILRFNDVLQRVQARERMSWTSVAHHCGYSDQFHFIRDFKHFSGFNPKEYLRQDLDMGQIGGLWYGPLFGRAWTRASGLSEEELAARDMPRVFGVSLALVLVAAIDASYAVVALSTMGALLGAV